MLMLCTYFLCVQNALAVFQQVIAQEPQESKKAVVTTKIKEFSKRLAELTEANANKNFAKGIQLEEQVPTAQLLYIGESASSI